MTDDEPHAAAHREVVANALRNLLRDPDPEAFVVFDVPSADRFVQFSGGTDEPLVLDLPRPSLADEEWEPCKAALTPLGAVVEDLGFETLTLDCGRDVERATDAVLAVFHGALGIAPDAKLSADSGE